jgi:Reverse transcriptase (RNA-dependent DNA polymerase)
VKGLNTWIETLLKGNMTQKEHLAKVTKVAISQLEEGNELYVTIKAVKMELIKINKMTITQQMAEKAYNTGKVNMEQTVPMVFKQHWKVFSEQKARQLPPRCKWDHKIELKPDAPDIINSKVYPLLKDEQKALDKYIMDNLDKGYITALASPYRSPTFMVKKKDGTFHIVHDYQKLNEYTIMDITPLPHIQSILEELRGKMLFSKFDIRAGYNNIWIAEGDEFKTGFKMSKGLFEWVVMPFGLCNTPGMFTHIMFNMGNSWVFLLGPVPAPIHTPTHNSRYGFAWVWVRVQVFYLLSHSSISFIFEEQGIYNLYNTISS